MTADQPGREYLPGDPGAPEVGDLAVVVRGDGVEGRVGTVLAFNFNTFSYATWQLDVGWEYRNPAWWVLSVRRPTPNELAAWALSDGRLTVTP